MARTSANNCSNVDSPIMAPAELLQTFAERFALSA